MIVYGRRIHPMEMVQRIDAVDIPALLAVARKYIHNKSPATSAYGPLQHFPNTETLHKYLSPPQWMLKAWDTC